MKISLDSGDALIVVDMQNDFLTNGRLAVTGGDKIIPLLNCYIAYFYANNRPIFATRDWHPPDHCSFVSQGGPWPPHCIAGSTGAAFHAELVLPADAHIVSKATSREADAYSGFSGTGLHELLQSLCITRIFTGGIATEYCIRHTVKDALQLGYSVVLLEDAIQAINRQPHDGALALQDMIDHGVRLIHFQELAA
ncbi:isochorismatase family protein [Nitrosomonas supralitoralis]|uniref:nicotinamidase n=1 Tax=Nitrosomonas supralitoralis TaxID=2116706 RepID=A0A2P7NRR7_9PROT|nr:isochorismatase family protein [Nitrosomonas supralitoralis]PSJ16129.1 nicotinamidase [Nitrosomonas supralitoralis]